jgi:hypothetical protein
MQALNSHEPYRSSQGVLGAFGSIEKVPEDKQGETLRASASFILFERYSRNFCTSRRCSIRVPGSKGVADWDVYALYSRLS